MNPPEMDLWLRQLLDKIDDHCARTELKIDNLIQDIEKRFVTKVELSPIKIIVFGLAGCILMAFIGLVIFKVGWK